MPIRIHPAALVVAACLGAPAAAQAATTFTVTRTDDPAPGACDSDCSLREAVLAADAGSGGDTISLPAGTYRLTIAGQNEDLGATGDLDLTKAVTIAGAGAQMTTIDAMATDRALDIHGAVVTISGVTITGGGDKGSDGGGIETNSALTLRGVTVRDNDIGFANGGGVDAGGPLTVTDSTIARNHGYNGGGINYDSTLTMTNSTVSGNRGGDEGDNGDGGGVEGSGGSSAHITDSTIAFNEAFNGATSGGGINGGSVTLKGTIVADNVAHATDLTTTNVDNCSATVTSAGHNLSDGTDCGLTAAGDQQGVDPALLPLALGGGTTETHALAPGSPAIDHGGSACSGADQRGIPRPQGPQCDIGAFEVFVAPLPPPATAVSVTAPAKVKLKRFLKGLRPRATPTVPAKLTFELVGTAKLATLAAHDNLILASASLPMGGGARSARLKPSRKLLGKPRKTFRVTVRVAATDAAGRRVVATRRVKVVVKSKHK